jgi:RNA polymerase sigma factor (sigma-70 family)
MPLTGVQPRPSSGEEPSPLTDGELRTLLVQDPGRGWRAFIDQYTPLLLALIERAGIRDREEAMEIYVLVCERLAADDCARLRKHDPGRGALGAWLSVLVRHVLVDWVRSRAGRRRLFKSIKGLPPLDQRVFELFYWENRQPAEMVELLVSFGSPSLVDVLSALDRVHAALTQRQRAELLATAARVAKPVSLDAAGDETDRPYEVADPTATPEELVQERELDRLINRALAALPPGEAAILRLKYMEGLSLGQIRQALHLDQLTEQHVQDLFQRFKTVFGTFDASVAQRS